MPLKVNAPLKSTIGKMLFLVLPKFKGRKMIGSILNKILKYAVNIDIDPQKVVDSIQEKNSGGTVGSQGQSDLYGHRRRERNV